MSRRKAAAAAAGSTAAAVRASGGATCPAANRPNRSTSGPRKRRLAADGTVTVVGVLELRQAEPLTSKLEEILLK